MLPTIYSDIVYRLLQQLLPCRSVLGKNASMEGDRSQVLAQVRQVERDFEFGFRRLFKNVDVHDLTCRIVGYGKDGLL